jgi:hypothetical protein
MSLPIIILLAIFIGLIPWMGVAMAMWHRGELPFFHRRFICPCCGYLTLHERPPDSWEICPVCFWQQDPGQNEDPDDECGANNVSLNQARANFHLFSAAEQRVINYVRKPLDSERPK